MARIEADKDEGGIRIASMASNRSYLVRGGGGGGGGWKRRSREWLTTVSMLTKGIKVFEYVRLCQVSFLLRGHVPRFAQRATDTSAHFLRHPTPSSNFTSSNVSETIDFEISIHLKFYKYIREYFFLINQKEASSDLYALDLMLFFLEFLLIHSLLK